MTEALFHYTDAVAVKSILENEELWLSDIRFLNDSEEFNDGARYIIDALDGDLPYTELGAEYVEYARGFIKEGFDSHVSLGIDQEPTFVCSFSKVGDLLSQWRGYGAYAVEFDRLALQESTSVYNCFYIDDQKNQMAREHSNSAIRLISEEMANGSGVIGPDGAFALSSLVRLASLFKNHSFHQEEEVRCAIEVKMPNAEVDFRSRNGILVPYFKQKFPIQAVRAIHVGPMRDQELAFTSMSALVSKVKWSFESRNTGTLNINVLRSRIPYRD